MTFKNLFKNLPEPTSELSVLLDFARCLQEETGLRVIVRPAEAWCLQMNGDAQPVRDGVSVCWLDHTGHCALLLYVPKPTTPERLREWLTKTAHSAGFKQTLSDYLAVAEAQAVARALRQAVSPTPPGSRCHAIIHVAEGPDLRQRRCSELLRVGSNGILMCSVHGCRPG